MAAKDDRAGTPAKPASGAGGLGARALGRFGRTKGAAPAGRSVTRTAPRRRKAPKGARRAAAAQRFGQLRMAFSITRKADPQLVPLLVASFLAPFVLLLALGLLLGHPVYLGIVGLLLSLVITTAVFGRRAQRNAYSQVEGQLGAAAAVLDNMRGDWRVTPAVGFSREQDLVHRVLGRPGIVLVAEGAPGRTRGLLATEKKRLARFVGDTPVYDVSVGDGEGQVPLRGLEKHLLKLPRNIKPKDVNILDRKLKAMAPALPIPKGPVPMGGRVPRGKVR